MTLQDEKLLDEKFGRLHDKLDNLVSIDDRVLCLEKDKNKRSGFFIALTFVVTLLTIFVLIEQLKL